MAFGAVKGTLSGSGASVTNPSDASGSVVVAVGDLVIAVMAQQTALSVTAVTDNLGNTYTAQNAGTDAGTSTGRMFQSRVTVPGTLTVCHFAATASANNYSVGAVVYTGPFRSPAIDKNLANTTDATSPYTATATGTLAQADELIIGWICLDGATISAVSPAVINLNVVDAGAATQLTIESWVVRSTSTVTPSFTAPSDPASAVVGSATFAAEATVDKWARPFPYSALSRAMTPAVMASGFFMTPTPLSLYPAVIQTFTSIPYRKTLLYQALFGPPPFPPVVVAETITLDKWWQPLATPTRRVGLGIENQDYLFNSPSLIVTDFITVAYNDLAVPYRKYLLYQSLSYSPYVVEVVAETIFPDKWWMALSEPTRRVSQACQQDPITYDPLPRTTDLTYAWFSAFSIPTRLIPGAWKPSYIDDPFPRTVDQYAWYKPLSEPTRRSTRPWAYDQPFDFDPFPFTVENYAWYRPLSEPTRLGGLGTVQQDALFNYPFPVITVETITLDKWWQAFTDPMRRISQHAPQSQAIAFYPFPYTADLQYGWFKSLSEPTRPIPGAWRPSLSFDPFPRTVEQYAWFRQLSEPTRRTPAVSWVPTFWYDPAPFAFDLKNEWFRALSEPTRPIPGAWRPSLFFDPFPRTVEEYAWRPPLSQPTLRITQSWRYGEFKLSQFPVPPSEIVTLDKWFKSFSEPNRIKGLTTADQMFKSAMGPFPIPTVAPNYGWYSPLNEPTRRKSYHGVLYGRYLPAYIVITPTGTAARVYITIIG